MHAPRKAYTECSSRDLGAHLPFQHSRRSSKAEKARAIEEDRNDDKGNDEGEEEKNNEAGELREKTKGDYLPFDATKHFYWATTVSLGFLFCSCSGLFS